MPTDSRRFVALRFAQYGLLLAVGVVTARALGPTGRAAYIVPLTIVAVVWVVLHLTLHEAVGRLIGRGHLEPSEATRILVTATLGLSAIGFAIYAVTYAIGGTSLFGGASSATIWLAGATLLPMMWVSYACDLLVRVDALRASGWGVLVGGLVQITGISIFWATGELTPASAVAMSLVSFSASSVVLSLSLRRLLGGEALIPTRDVGTLRSVLVIGAPLHSGTLTLQLGPRVDLLLVAALFDEDDTGFYSLAMVLADAVFLSCRVLAELALPSQTGHSDALAIAGTKRVTRISAVIGIAFGLVGAAMAPLLIPLVFGDEWEPAVVPLIALIAASGAIGIVIPVRTLLARMYVPARLATIAVSTLVANVVLTIALSQFLGLPGAAAASTIVFWVYAGVLLVVMRRIEEGHVRVDRRVSPEELEEEFGPVPGQEPLL